MNHSRWILAVLAITLTSCTSLEPHRDASIPDTAVDFQTAQREHSAIHDAIMRQMWERYKEPDFYLATIEFSERGHLFHPNEAYELVDRIKSLASVEGATIVVFVHGWHHNGCFDGGNQNSLRQVLAKLAKLQDSTFHFGMQNFREEMGRKVTSRPPLIGVSLAWRGESSTNIVLKWLSFYDRKIVAHRVGGTRLLQDAILGIPQSLDARKLIERLDADYRELNAQGNLTSLTFVGHSFGAALLFSATEETFKNELKRKDLTQVDALMQLNVKPETTVVPLLRGVGDAVILVNPAFEARRYRVFGKLTEGGYTFSPLQIPKLIIFSSDGDSANRIAFPIGRYLSSAAWVPSWFQWNQRRTAVGFYRADQTHWLRLQCEQTNGCGPEPVIPGFDQDDTAHVEGVMRAPDDFDVSRDTDYGRFRFDLKDQRKNLAHTPFIVARTSRLIVPSHSEIFGDTFNDFLARFFAELEVQNTKRRFAEYQSAH